MTTENASPPEAELVSDLDEWHRLVCAAPDLTLEHNGQVLVGAATVKAVLLAYRCYMDGPEGPDPGGNAYPDPQVIADQLGLSLSAVERSLRVGVERCLLVRTARAAPRRRATYHAARPSPTTDERPSLTPDVDSNVRHSRQTYPPTSVTGDGPTYEVLGGKTTTPREGAREATPNAAGGGGDPPAPQVDEILSTAAEALGSKGRMLSRSFLAGDIAGLLEVGWSPSALARRIRDELTGANVKRSATKYVEAVLQRLANEPPETDGEEDEAEAEQLLERFREAVPDEATRHEIRDEALRALAYRDGNGTPDDAAVFRECLAIAEASERRLAGVNR